MQWVKSNWVCRNSTHLRNTCSILNKLKFYLVKTSVYILNYFKKKAQTSKKKSKTLKNLVYSLYTIWYVIATITQEQTERATHSEGLIIMLKDIKTQTNKRG